MCCEKAFTVHMPVHIHVRSVAERWVVGVVGAPDSSRVLSDLF